MLIINELFTEVCTLVTASLCYIPFNLSLNTPVIDEHVCSTLSIANYIACIA
nr:MAG TPA: hypothetical protein [Caudoviricetes sp.]DAS12190.1 MAG TPA: hypothetical protein [Caudoviricetes sp.]